MAMAVNTGNATSVSIALPTIATDWRLEEAELQWPIAAYPLSSGCLLLAFGRVADLYGRRRTFVAGSLFLTTFTLACGFANSVLALTILRGIQGIGAAATIPASLGILAHEFPPGRARSFAFAAFSAGAPLGGVTGTAIGGVLTQYTAKTWRSAFWLMVGLSTISVFGGIVSLSPDMVDDLLDDKWIDWVGSFLVSAGLVSIVFVLSEGEIAPQRWRTPYVITLLVVGVTALLIFCLWQRYLEKVNTDVAPTNFSRTPPPIMKLSLWKRDHGKYACMMIIAFVNWCAFLIRMFLSPLYYQQYLKLDVIHTVVRFLPMFASGVLCNVIVGTAAARVPVVYLTAFGTATGFASLLFAIIEPERPYWAYGFPAALISVMGADLVFSAGTLYIAKVSLPHEQSVSGAIFNTMTQLGTAMGVTVSTVVFNRVRTKQLGAGEDLLKAYQSANWTGFAFGMTGTLLSILFFYDVGVVGDKEMRPTSVEEVRHVERD